MEHEPRPWRQIAYEFKRIDRLYCSIDTALTVTREAYQAIGFDLEQSRVTFPNPHDPPPETFTLFDTALMPRLSGQIASLKSALIRDMPEGKGEELTQRIHGHNLAITEKPDPQIRVQPEVIDRTPEYYASLALWTGFWQAKIDKEFADLQEHTVLNLAGKTFSFEFSFLPEPHMYADDEERLVVFVKSYFAEGLQRITGIALIQLAQKDPLLHREVAMFLQDIQNAIITEEDISFVLEPTALARLKQLVPTLDLT